MKRTKTSLVAVIGGGLAACSLILAGPAAAAGHPGPGVSRPSVGSNEAAQPADATDHTIGLELPIAPVGATGPGNAATTAQPDDPDWKLLGNAG
ncbi:hypothetical protein OG976_22475 [Mycobacterium sp. NBC_00419]|uniref:hypothetical protein n=1 Tax=Mycobacterium sp. NBC_00419 TaxID=2975989 RepID=UPI002E1BF88D